MRNVGRQRPTVAAFGLPGRQVVVQSFDLVQLRFENKRYPLSIGQCRVHARAFAIRQVAAEPFAAGDGKIAL